MMPPFAAVGAALLLLISVCPGTAGAQSPGAVQRAVDCLIHPKSVVKVGSPVGGILAEVNVDRGDKVEQGQVLFRLRSEVEEASVEFARARAGNDSRIESGLARLHFQKRRLERGDELMQKKVMAQSAYEEAQRDARLSEFELREARAEQRLATLELNRAQQILAQRTVHSPISGVVTERSMSAGEYVHEQAAVLTIARLDILYVEAFLPIALYGTVAQGMRLEVRPSDPIGGTFLATVTVIDRVLDPASGTFGLRLELPNPDYRLPAGLRCRLAMNQG
jgi:RND family efflux transporter MFP subunit